MFCTNLNGLTGLTIEGDLTVTGNIVNDSPGCLCNNNGKQLLLLLDAVPRDPSGVVAWTKWNNLVTRELGCLSFRPPMEELIRLHAAYMDFGTGGVTPQSMHTLVAEIVCH